MRIMPFARHTAHAGCARRPACAFWSRSGRHEDRRRPRLSGTECAAASLLGPVPARIAPQPPAPPLLSLLLREVIKIHEEVARGVSGAKSHWDRRTAMKYLSPHLTGVGIELRKASNKLGYVYCAPMAVVLSARGKPHHARNGVTADGGADALTVDDERKALLAMSERFGTVNATRSYENGEWCIENEIKAVPAAIWARAVLTVASRRKRRDWLQIFRATGELTYPVSNYEVPHVCGEMDPPLARLSIQVFSHSR